MNNAIQVKIRQALFFYNTFIIQRMRSYSCYRSVRYTTTGSIPSQHLFELWTIDLLLFKGRDIPRCKKSYGAFPKSTRFPLIWKEKWGEGVVFSSSILNPKGGPTSRSLCLQVPNSTELPSNQYLLTLPDLTLKIEKLTLIPLNYFQFVSK